MVFASGGYPDRETVGVDANGTKVWSNKTKVYEPSLVVSGEHLFAIEDGGIAWCWDAKYSPAVTRSICWRGRAR